MCEYVNDNMCMATSCVCPYMYRCPNTGKWQENKYMPKNCKMKNQAKAPSGEYKVRFEKKGYLYVEIGDFCVKAANPYDYIPTSVKMTKDANGEWVVKK